MTASHIQGRASYTLFIAEQNLAPNYYMWHRAGCYLVLYVKGHAQIFCHLGSVVRVKQLSGAESGAGLCRMALISDTNHSMEQHQQKSGQ